ncbi:DinB family protein [Niabella beijingensis]|uniref:DinB family protein n=1 Tax=Niabella beijingensis TaxID=2872700 RepID=UPI001CBAB504|nr:DinB family protein [Niabella beijingensis]MBZ4190398.1 DinB family protein [Niabella beijingensis]
MQTTTAENGQLLREFSTAADTFIRTLSRVPEAAFNTAPFEGSWSPAQVGDHVLKFLSGIKGALALPQAEPGRAPDAHEPLLREIFLNFERKAKAPAIVAPSDETIHKDALMHALKGTSEILGTQIGEGNLLLLCEGAPFPTIGDMTGLEWVLFGTYHLQRHTRQLVQMQSHSNTASA